MSAMEQPLDRNDYSLMKYYVDPGVNPNISNLINKLPAVCLIFILCFVNLYSLF